MNPPMEVEKSEKVPLVTKLAFGAGDVGPAIVAAITGFFLLFFFTDVAGLSPAEAGFILLLSTIWDAVNDPLIGQLSDRTRTRWGRRRPWFLFGAIPFGITFLMLFWVPPLTGWALTGYYLFALVLHKTAFTAVNVPYTALTPALTSDYQERTSLNTFRFMFSIISGLVAAVLHPTIVAQAATPQEGYLLSIGLWAIVGTIPFFFAFWGTYEKPIETEEKTVSFLDGFRVALRSRAFVIVSGIYFLSWLVVQTISTVVVYFATYWLNRPDDIALIILSVQGSALVWLLIWERVSRRIGKKGVYYYGMSFWILVSFLLFLVPRDAPSWHVYVLGILAGVGVATAYLVPWSMLPDVVELDELENGERREGVFYGYFVFFQQIGVAVGLWAIGQLLSLTGYITPEAGQVVSQPDAALFAIRLLVGPIPAVILAAGILLVYLFPITKEQHERTLAELAKRKAARGTI
jgi:GPH family glycoside/pentoside/hexuronide:cation symporter